MFNKVKGTPLRYASPKLGTQDARKKNNIELDLKEVLYVSKD